MPVPAAAHVAAWVLLGGGVVAVLVGQHDAKSRLEALERTPPPAASSGAVPAAESARAPDFAVLQGRVEASEKRNADQVEEIKKEVQRLWAEWMKSPEGTANVADMMRDPKFDDAVRAVVDRYAMERKFRETIQKATGPLVPKKPTFDQLAKALELRATQAEKFSTDIRQIQQELFELLSVPRADGVALLEEIQQAEQYPEGSPKKTEVFLKLFKLTIPDTQETYIERAISLASRVRENAKGYFEPGQFDTLATMDLDWFGIRFQ